MQEAFYEQVAELQRYRRVKVGYTVNNQNTVGICRRTMGKKRSRDEEDCAVDSQPKTMQPSSIKNKIKRSMVHAKLKQEKKLEKKKRTKSRDAAEKRALELGEEPPKPKVPHTIENTREADETVCRPDDEELFADNAGDEFSAHFSRIQTPKVLITTSRFRCTRGNQLIEELLSVIPNAHYYKRGTFELKKIVEYAKNQDFTFIIVVHTNRSEPNGMLFINLPDGPTAHFNLSSLVLRKDIKNHGNPTTHQPELILNNFTTRLGHRIGRMIASVFPHDPNFRGRRVVTFHNQRDFIFFRHHRYIFETKEVNSGKPKGKTTEDGKKKTKGTCYCTPPGMWSTFHIEVA